MKKIDKQLYLGGIMFVNHKIDKYIKKHPFIIIGFSRKYLYGLQLTSVKNDFYKCHKKGNYFNCDKGYEHCPCGNDCSCNKEGIYWCQNSSFHTEGQFVDMQMQREAGIMPQEWVTQKFTSYFRENNEPEDFLTIKKEDFLSEKFNFYESDCNIKTIYKIWEIGDLVGHVKREITLEILKLLNNVSYWDRNDATLKKMLNKSLQYY